MRIIFAPDSFKGTLSAVQVCDLLAQACARHFPGAEMHSIPVADGGEGTVEALVLARGGRTESVGVTGPMGGQAQAVYGVLDGGEVAVLEMAQASGLPMVPADARNPLKASSFGTGEMIAHVLQKGYRRLMIGLGGSATNDGGMGMLAALGARFADAEGNQLQGCGADLAAVATADFAGLLPALAGAEITVISDVTNPLLGESGATAVYGPQKGATGPMLAQLEDGMAHYADVVERALGKDIRSMPGAGAAGGLGAALGGVLGARIQPGIDAVLDVAGFDPHLPGTDLVITGEGRIDGQSIRYGKVPAGVAKRCAPYGVPVVAIVGGMAEGAEALYDLAEASIITTINGVMPLEEALENAEALFADAADRLFRMLKIGQRLPYQA